MPGAVGTKELTDLAQRLRMQAFDAYARVVDASLDPTDNFHLHFLALWDERHTLDEFRAQALAFLRCLGDQSFSKRD